MVKEALQALTGKKYVYLMDSWISAFTSALDRCFEVNVEGFGYPSTFLIPEDGGRAIFLAQKDNFNLVKLKTSYASLLLTHLRAITNEKSALLVSSLAGSFVRLQMAEIEEICNIKKTLLINDVSASIGSDLARYGDIIVGGFGKNDLVNLGYGGFIASNERLVVKENFDLTRLDQLNLKISDLSKRYVRITAVCKKVKEDLKDFDVLHKDHESVVVVVKYRNDEEKNKILKYCADNKFEYLECPKYSRVKEKAISIEVKRWD